MQKRDGNGSLISSNIPFRFRVVCTINTLTDFTSQSPAITEAEDDDGYHRSREMVTLKVPSTLLAVDNKERVREIYERAIANVPPAEEKRYWQRYIYTWIDYALYVELEAQDVHRTRDVYGECLKLIPHKKFSFAKIWLMAAQFEIRQLNLSGARSILGNAIGVALKDKKVNLKEQDKYTRGFWTAQSI